MGSSHPYRMGAILWTILPLEASRGTPHDRCLHRAMGVSEIQTVPKAYAGGLGMVALASAAQSDPVRPLGLGTGGWMMGAG